jgi:L-lactate dehydrogenase complex protein LldF
LSFAERAAQMLAGPAAGHLRIVCDEASRLRRARLGEYGDAREGLHRRGRAIRENAIARLDQLVERFTGQATAAGATVHFAGDAAEARAIVVGIARANQSKLAIKMKSMLSEELHIREALGEAETRALETDLGEWIIQLAQEKPAHIVMPALHKTRDQVKALFEGVMGDVPETTAHQLVGRARGYLRREFVRADLGITGVNFAVAESGALVMVENEGNGRLTMSSPAVNITLVPVEKLVPTLNDAVTLLRLLTASATGQKVTRYVSFVRGPRSAGEVDGPRELHIVLVDNGRSSALGTELEEALLCLRCGSCLNVCPVFKCASGQAYPGAYSGPIGVIVTEILEPGSAGEVAHASSLCQACRDACPVRIDLPRMIHAVRRREAAAGRGPAPLREQLKRFARACLDPARYTEELASGAWAGVRTAQAVPSAPRLLRELLSARTRS